MKSYGSVLPKGLETLKPRLVALWTNAISLNSPKRMRLMPEAYEGADRRELFLGIKRRRSLTCATVSLR